MINNKRHLTDRENLSLIAPAGCGKTESIARAVSEVQGRQLILTHTHAGVRSLRMKLRKNGVSPAKYNLETLDGWFLKYAAAYPSMSGLIDSIIVGEMWSDVLQAANRLFLYPVVKEILKSTYDGVYVDEYQDCSKDQHAVILKIAEFLPVRVLGDPLQGILDFKKNILVDWDLDVIPNFTPLPPMNKPWRWIDKNPPLGEWFMELRTKLENGESIDLSQAKNITWLAADFATRAKLTFSILKRGGSFVAILMYPNEAHRFAKGLGGRVQSMEEVECKDLITYARRMDGVEGIELIKVFTEFLLKCITNAEPFAPVKSRLNKIGKIDFTTMKNKELGLAFQTLLLNRNYQSMAFILKNTLDDASINKHRRELMMEMLRAIDSMTTGKYQTIHESAWQTRSYTRRVGRELPASIVSRPPLIKGLEFDHVLLAESDQISGIKNFYVSATRAIRSLTIISSDPTRFYRPY